MNEEMGQLIGHVKEGMEAALLHLENELVKVRAGKASPAMINGLMVDYYGAPTPLGQLSNISTSDARTIVIQPWDKKALASIERAIFEANLGFTPMNDGEVVRISVPPLTEERRKDLTKRVKTLGEEAKVGLRSVRQKAMESIKKATKDGYPEDSGKRLEAEVQSLTDTYTKKVDHMVEVKDKEIMTV